MAQPPTYNRQVSFQDYQSSSPSAPLSGTSVDSELNQIKITLDAILNNLALIQRDDGELSNQSVGSDQLAPSLAVGFNSPTQWLTATDYTADVDTVFNNNSFYVCRTSHTSGTFSTDLAAVKWELLADLSTSNTIDDGSLANAKLADMAASTIKGRIVSTGVPQDLTVAQVRTILSVGSGSETDNTVARWSGTAGALQGSGVVVDDSDNISGLGTIGASGAASVVGSVTVAGTASEAAKLVLGEDTDNGAHALTLQAAASMSASFTLTAPNADGTANYGLGTDGSGALGWYPYARLNATNNFADSVIQRAELKDCHETVQALGALGGGSVAIDIENGAVITATIDTAETTLAFNNPSPTSKACSFTLILTNPGSQTLNFPAGTVWAGGSPPAWTASGVDIVELMSINAGTAWYAMVAGQDFS